MDSLPKRYADFFLAMKKRPLYFQYYMAFDAEWYEVAGQNIVISYQIATRSSKSYNNIIEYMEPGRRLTLAEIIELGIKSVNNGIIPDDHTQSLSKTVVRVISHYTTAEWSVLADRKADYIIKNLISVRKSPVTSKYGIPLKIGGNCNIIAHLSDTRLIAPATHQKLSDLSKLLGSDEDVKIVVEPYYKKRMHLLLRDNPKKYEEYALQDSRITLELYFLLQESLCKLAGVGLRHITLGSAAVTGYILNYENYHAYQAVLNSYHYTDAYKLIKRAYLGGRSEGYFVGRSWDYSDQFGDRLWVDIDFIGCYPTAMALCPTIDCQTSPFDDPIKINDIQTFRTAMKNVKINHKPFQAFRTAVEKAQIDDIQAFRKAMKEAGVNDIQIFIAAMKEVKIDMIPLTYRLDERTDEAIHDLGVPVEVYREVKAILDKYQQVRNKEKRAAVLEEFNDYLNDLRKKAKDRKERGQRTYLIRKIRALAKRFDNTHLDRWYKQWKEKGDEDDSLIERYIIPGFARVDFEFPVDTEFPCLAIPHHKYGLIYPLKGEAVATVPELMLALDAGATINVLTSLEMTTLKDGDGPMPRRHFFDHLALLTVKRTDYKADSKDKPSSEERRKALIMERLVKEFLNSFYGKGAQAIKYRKTYSVKTGEMDKLGHSKISEACAAALTTGLPRAALSAVLLAIQEYNKGKDDKERIIVVSATTDGLLAGLPRPDGFITADYYEMDSEKFELSSKHSNVEEMLEKCGCSDLWKLINAYLPIRQMRYSRKALTGDDDTFLEIKHLADRIVGVKTRGQLGWIDFHGEQITTIMAKFGHKPPLTEIVEKKYPNLTARKQEAMYGAIYDEYKWVRNTLEAEWIMEQLNRVENGGERTFDYTFYGLTGFNEMMKHTDHLDMTQKIGRKIFNGDFDWKRKLVLDNGLIDPRTKPFLDLTEMKDHRSQMQSERRWKRNANVLRVLHKAKLKGTQANQRGGEAATVVRLFLRGILHDHIPYGTPLPVGRIIVEMLNDVWVSRNCSFDQGNTVKSKKPKPPVKMDKIVKTRAKRGVKTKWIIDDVKNAGGAKRWERGAVISNLLLEELLHALALKFDADFEQAKAEIFAQGLEEEFRKDLAFYVVQAVLQAPGLGQRPFSNLYLKELLPPKAEILSLMHPHLSEADIVEAERKPFIAGQCWANEQPMIVRLFRMLKFSKRDADACALVLAPPRPHEEGKVPRNPAVNRCLECFVQAVQQPDIVPHAILPVKIWDRLRRFGMTRQRYYSWRKNKFAPRTLTDTPGNRSQINKMAGLLELDPTPIMDALLDR